MGLTCHISCKQSVHLCCFPDPFLVRLQVDCLVLLSCHNLFAVTLDVLTSALTRRLRMHIHPLTGNYKSPGWTLQPESQVAPWKEDMVVCHDENMAQKLKMPCRVKIHSSFVSMLMLMTTTTMFRRVRECFGMKNNTSPSPRLENNFVCVFALLPT